jgi:hypothetical protein
MNIYTLQAEADDEGVVAELVVETIYIEGGVKTVFNYKSVDSFIREHRYNGDWVSLCEVVEGVVVKGTGVFDAIDVVAFILVKGEQQ